MISPQNNYSPLMLNPPPARALSRSHCRHAVSFPAAPTVLTVVCSSRLHSFTLVRALSPASMGIFLYFSAMPPARSCPLPGPIPSQLAWRCYGNRDLSDSSFRL